MSEFLSEAQQLLQSAAPSGRSVKERITLTARRLRWSPARVKAVWYGEARRIDAHELEALRRAANARVGNPGHTNDPLEEELRDLRRRVARLDALVASLSAPPARAVDCSNGLGDWAPQ